MVYFEIIIAFLIGLLLMLLLGWVFSLKTKGLTRILINALTGAGVLCALTLFGIAAFPLNPLNGLLTGFLGLPGLVVIYLVSVYL